MANALERSIALRQVDGTFAVITSTQGMLERLEGDFQIMLDPDASSHEQACVDADANRSIRERMNLCPDWRSWPASVQKTMALYLNT